MNCVAFLILFFLNFVLFSCKGQVFPPSNENITVLPGSTARLKWTFTGDASRAGLAWFFTRRRNGSKEEEIAAKFRNNPAIIENSSLSGVVFEPLATLVLKDVDERYNGKYRFSVQLVGGGGEAEVELYIAAKPNVTIVNCSGPTTVNENDNFKRVCRSQGGNPPANLTWYKDGVQIGKTSYGENILTLTNVTKQDRGRYTCKAQSYTLVDEEPCEIIVHYKPTNTTINVPKAYIGKKFTITCTSDGLPVPNITITHNGTIVSNTLEYIKNNAQYNDTGTYKCTAMNVLGMNSDSGNLTVIKGQITPTPTIPTPNTSYAATSSITSNETEPAPTTPPTSASTSASTSSPPGGLSTGAIIGIIIGVLVLIIIVVVVVVYYCKSKEKERSNNSANIDPVPGNGHELEEPGPSDGAYDTVWTSGSKSKAPVENALPPVYAAVDKNNRQGNTLYASLDNKALKSSRASKKEPDRPQQTEYASIDFAKSAPKAV